MEIRDFIIERGLKECKELLAKGEGTPGFYHGACDGFEECRKYQSFEELEAPLSELAVKSQERYRAMCHPDRTKKELEEYCYWAGFAAQLEFVRDRLAILQGKPGVVSARAVLDLEEILKGGLK